MGSLRVVRVLRVLAVLALVTAPAAPAAAGTAGRLDTAGSAARPAAAGGTETAGSAAGPATTGGTAGAAGRPAAAERLVFRFKDARITESSGLALSPAHPGVYYTHNDSGAQPMFFAVGGDGRTRAAFTVAGAQARDWEGMAASVDPATGQGVLWFADIGDNLNGAWADYSIYKVPEPRTLRDATVPATRYRVRYKDGARNAEGIMVHPRTGRLYVISKEFAGSVYQAPARLRTDRVNVLRRVGPAPIMATDAAYAPDGSSFVIRTYLSASLYRAPGELIGRVTMPSLRQAESIAYTRNGRALLTGTEGVNSPVYEVPLPAQASPRRLTAEPPRTTAPPTRAAGGASARNPEQDADGGVPGSLIALWLGIALGATGIIALIARRAQ
ncbi:hypothetical protein ABGB17_10520 [Sphaerisporangium sp. B11E5]|uniref:hypothetical protein n=1 Tax=Sphaerisporangium sp. B11E5 TaxID=3153563 RepID=UPI00325CCADE